MIDGGSVWVDGQEIPVRVLEFDSSDGMFSFDNVGPAVVVSPQPVELEIEFSLDPAVVPVIFNHSLEVRDRMALSRMAAQEALLRMQVDAPSVGDMEIAASLMLPPGALSTDELLGVLDPLGGGEPEALVDPPPDDPRVYIWPPPEELPERASTELLLALGIRAEQGVRASLERGVRRWVNTTA